MSYHPETNQESKARAYRFINSLVKLDEDLGNTPMEQIATWKQQNQVQTILRAINMLNHAPYQPGEIRIKDLSKWLEYTAYADNEAVQSKWAALLVNALNPGKSPVSFSVFVEMLNQISCEEAGILELLVKESFQTSSEDRKWLSIGYVARYFHIDYRNAEILKENLTRLGLIESTILKEASSIDDPYFGKSTQPGIEKEKNRISRLGLLFVEQLVVGEE